MTASADRELRGPTVVLVTDPRYARERIEEVIEAARVLPPRALVVQLRDKAAPIHALASTARSLRAAATHAGALFVVNASTTEALRVAADSGADGVHVPCRTEAIADARALVGSTAWISTPAHGDADVTTAARAGATSVLVSPIFDTPGKAPARGVQALEAARALAGDLLVYALGGIDASRAPACAAVGADGVAVVRALLDATDVAATARALDAAFRRPSGRAPIA
jgi:thiamine-phosphate pyrophosphorylase